MGMYDSIDCSDEMPYNDEMISLGLSARNWSFQTKDLDCSLSVYVLQGGILMEYSSGPYVENTKHHGKIRMYDYRQDVLGKWDCWIEYEVTFTDGKVTNTELVEFRKDDNTERVTKWKQLTDSIEAEHNKWSNRFFFHTKPVMYIKRLTHKALYIIGNGILSLSYKI